MADSKDTWIQCWTAEQPMFKHYAQAERLIECRNIISNVARKALFYSINGVARMYITTKSYQEMQKDGKKLLNPKIAKKTLKDIEETIKTFWLVAKKLRVLVQEENTLQNKKFIKLFKRFDGIVIKIFAYFSTTWEATSYYPEEKLKKILKSYFPHDWEEKFRILIIPSEPDLLLKEKISWAKLLKKPTKKSIKAHMLNFPFLFGNIDSEKDSYQLMLKRSKSDSVFSLKLEIVNAQKRLKEIKILQNEISKKIKLEEVKNLSFLLQRFTTLRLELKNSWQGIHFYLFPLFSQIAKLANFSVRDIMMFWSMKDILKFLENRYTISKLDLKKRKEFYFLLFDKNKISFYTGKKAKKIKSQILDKFLPTKIKEFKGSIANKGRVSGIVRLIQFDDLRVIEKTAKSIKEKFILTTGMTNPNVIPLIKKTKAIITDEGGITCHAAIISREFNIPCIIGTRIGTQVLKDGDLVEVDANKGIVKILKRAKR